MCFIAPKGQEKGFLSSRPTARLEALPVAAGKGLDVLHVTGLVDCIPRRSPQGDERCDGDEEDHYAEHGQGRSPGVGARTNLGF